MTHRIHPPAKWIPPIAHKYPVLSKLVSRLRIPVTAGCPKLKTSRGPEARMLRLRQTVTALVKYERLELNSNRAELGRAYTERLISDAIRYGPESEEMMDMADYWLLEKQLVHKLFKVLVPRFQTSSTCYTRLYRAPYWYFSDGFHPYLNIGPYDREVNEPDRTMREVSYEKMLLELKGNPFPPIFPSTTKNPLLLHNVLLSAAKTELNNHEKRKDASVLVENEGLHSTIEKLSESESRASSTSAANPSASA